MSSPILIVDDDPTQRLLIEYVLENEGGFSTQQAESGKDALELLGNSPSPAFGAIILDLNMPHVSGMETLKAIRTRCADIPVIMLSGSDRKEEEVAALQAGASDFLIKPANPQQLIEKMHQLMKR